MTDRQPPPHEPPVSDEELVAYLDGEADLGESRRIEDRLADDVQLGQRLRQFGQAWDLLDALPRARLDSSFTAATVEMVAVSARRERVAASLLARWRRWLWAAAATLAALTAGVAVRMVVPDPNRRLLEDLSVLEHLDEYRQVGSIEYLRQLEASGLFADPSSADHGASPPAAKESGNAR